MTMTPAQRQRQSHRERTGKYALVNPCYLCGKSAGEDYWSHHADETDSAGNSWGDLALVLCFKCYNKLVVMPDQQAFDLMMNQSR